MDFIKKTDPRALLSFYIFFISLVLFQSSFEASFFSALIVLILVLMWFSGYSLFLYVKRVLAVYPMIFFVSIMLPFADIAQNGQVISSFWGKSIYHSGMHSFILVNLKMVLILAASLFLVKASGSFRLLKSLELLKLPLWIISILTYMHRLFYLLSAEQSRMQIAFSARYHHLPLIKRIKALSGMTTVYLTRIVERSDRTYLAMLAKGFNGKMPNGKNLIWKFSDSLFCAGFIIYFGFILYAF